MIISQIAQQKVILKPGKERAVRNRHPWIFSGAVASLPQFKDGEFLPVFSSSKEFLGTGYFNHASSIVGRMVSFDSTPPLEAILRQIDQAVEMRTKFIDTAKTNAFRLINGEGDRLPGLIVDRYADIIVIQITTKGMDLLRPWLIKTIMDKFSPKGLYEKSVASVRKEEGLADVAGWVGGEPQSEVEVRENGLKFIVSIEEGQKTGFFLDHREMREQIRELSKQKKVLNCFSYTGGFSIYALAGGASRVDSVDISDPAMKIAQRNVLCNHFNSSLHQGIVQDVFHFLRENPLDYNLVILDPPAFAKRQKDIIPACRGYKDINRLVFQKVPAGSLVLTSSCSYHVDELLFQKVVFQASIEANRNVSIIGKHRLAIDHPINICHPEGNYLKSLLLHVE